MMGIRRTLKHKVKQAQPITIEILKRILPFVDVSNSKQLAIWVALLFCFVLFLRKSNLVPNSRIHDPIHQLSRRDIKIDQGLMIVHIKWSKTIQFGQRKLQIPMEEYKDSNICPLKWLCIMVNRIPAGGTHNLFLFWHNGLILLVTYRDLTIQMRKWLQLAGTEAPTTYSSHSLHRGGCLHAFENSVPESAIMILGDWVSQRYCRYIDLTVETRLKAWFLIPK